MVYDIVIIGTGPAGLSAGAYSGRRGYDTLFFENESIGGALVNRHEIHSYPGFPDGISGTDFRSRLVTMVEEYNPDVEITAVEAIEPGRPHEVRTDQGRYQARAVIIATGSRPKRLGVPGEEEYWGRGVFDCATCDGPLYAGERIAVVGGENHAIIDALFLTNHADEVVLIEASEGLSADDSLREDARVHSDIDVMTGARITEVIGEDGVVTAIRVADGDSAEERTEPVGGLNVNIGSVPNTEFVEETIPLDGDGRIIVGENMETEVEGIFAAGDVRQHSPLEVAAAVGDGVTAIGSATRYLEERS